MLKKLLIGLVLVVVVFLVIVATRPGSYTVERSMDVAAAPAEVFPFVAEFKKFVLWSPWEERDPNMKKTFEGTDGTVGSKYAWSGNEDVGVGHMTLTALTPNEAVAHQLVFVEPWESSATTGLALTPEDGKTRVTWSMRGDLDFMGKAMTLFMDMDEMVGQDFEQGLAALKGAVEKDAQDRAAAKAASEATAAAPSSDDGGAAED